MTKYFIISLLLIVLFLGLTYSKKKYVSDREIQCVENKERFIKGAFFYFNDYGDLGRNNFSDKLLSSYPRPYFSCRVSFKLHNLTSKEINAKYSIKSIRAKPERIINDINIHRSEIALGFIQSAEVKLKPQKARLIKLVIETNYGYETLKVKAWQNDKSI